MAAGNTSLPDDVKQIAKIGEGAFGDVFRVEWRGKPAAAKIIKKYLFDTEYNHTQKQLFVEKFKAESRLLAGLEHANIVQYYDVYARPGQSPVIIMELLDKDLASFIRESSTNPRVSFPDTVRIMLDVAKGLRYLHQQSIAHRDLSSKNALLKNCRSWCSESARFLHDGCNIQSWRPVLCSAGDVRQNGLCAQGCVYTAN